MPLCASPDCVPSQALCLPRLCPLTLTSLSIRSLVPGAKVALQLLDLADLVQVR